MKREFRVYDEGDKLLVREDVTKGAENVHKEERVQKKYNA